MGVTRYLADKSALARLHLPAVREELEPLMIRALVGICGVTELEMLYSARNIQERARMKEQLEASLDRVDIPRISRSRLPRSKRRSASRPSTVRPRSPTSSSRRPLAPAAWRSCTTTRTSRRSRATQSSRHAGSSHPARCNPVASKAETG